jgi:hypothetical protein
MHREAIVTWDILLFLVESPAKIEIQLQNTPIKRTPKPSPVTIFPRMSHNPERDILVWRTCCEYDKLGIVVSWYPLDMVCWGFGLVTTMSAGFKRDSQTMLDVHEVWVENIEFVPLYDFWWWVLGTAYQCHTRQYDVGGTHS